MTSARNGKKGVTTPDKDAAPKREFVRVGGRMNDALSKLAQAVYELGGDDNCIMRLVNDDALRDDVARRLTKDDVRCRTLQRMSEDACLDHCSGMITEDRFPADASDYQSPVATLCLGRDMSTVEARRTARQNGYEVASLAAMLGYLEQRGRRPLTLFDSGSEGDRVVVVLGSSWDDSDTGFRYHPIFTEDKGGRRVLDVIGDQPGKKSDKIWKAGWQVLIRPIHR